MTAHLQHPLGARAVKDRRLSSKKRSLRAPALHMALLLFSRQGAGSQPACGLRVCHHPQLHAGHQVCHEPFLNSNS